MVDEKGLRKVGACIILDDNTLKNKSNFGGIQMNEVVSPLVAYMFKNARRRHDKSRSLPMQVSIPYLHSTEILTFNQKK